MFETVQKLQGSQAQTRQAHQQPLFETVQKLQGSQAKAVLKNSRKCLRLYRNYKVLKLCHDISAARLRFETVQKLQGSQAINIGVSIEPLV